MGPPTRAKQTLVVKGSKAFKIATVERQLTSQLSIEAFCASEGLPKSTFQDWKKKYLVMMDKKIDLFHEQGGRPASINLEGLEQVKKKLMVLKKKSVSRKDVPFLA